ncbi:hypothetical protein WG902_07835 [Ramlibacter sp. PS3R-8]|uniref:hypothetical protein n=1 Tax=Ramlibacter sp. PS3R-8 TaxID=3133437 RepID=UPI0030B0827B
MSKPPRDLFKSIAQVVAILCLAGILAVIAHKGYKDMQALTRESSGKGFGVDLLRHIFRNLAG